MMLGSFNELQLSLIVAGLLAVAGVWGYNLWQERKSRQLMQRVFNDSQSDVLMEFDARATPADEAEIQAPDQTRVGQDDRSPAETSSRAYRPGGAPERIEPVFHPQDAEVAEEFHADEEVVVFSAAVEPVESSPIGSAMDSAVARVDHEVDHAIGSEPPPELADALVDCIVFFNAANLVSAPLFWAAQRQLLGRLASRLCWSGFDENSGKWQQLNAHDATSYLHLVGALQIADRSGPINAADLTLFCDGVRQLAAHYQAEIAVPVVADVLARALALDEFCAAVDWRIGINLVHRNGLALPVVDVKQLAQASGLRLAADGIFHAEDSAGGESFTLGSFGGLPFASEDVDMPTTPGVTLTIDVPRVAEGCAAFDRMLSLARNMMVALDAVLVDDQRAPLSDEVLAVIRAKIGEFQQKMAVNQTPAGGRRALRLYS